MADSTLRSALPNELADVYILKKFVPALEKKFKMMDFAEPAMLPPHISDTARWIKDVNISLTNIVAALDFAPPGLADVTYANRTENEADYTDAKVEAKIHTYGAFVAMRKPDLQQLPQNLADRIAGRLSFLAANTVDTLHRAVIDGTGNASPFEPTLGTGTTTTRKSDALGAAGLLAVGDILTAEEVALAVGDLRANDVEEFSNGLLAMVIHSGAEVDLITDVTTTRLNWQEMNKYVSGITGQEKLTKGFVGAIAGAMIFRSNNIAIATQDISAHHNLLFSRNALGALHMNDMKPRVFRNMAGSQTVSDPHRMFATIAVQWQSAPALIDSARCLALYTDAT